MRKNSLKIGITIGLRTEDESLWINGIKQNALFLARLFQGSEYGHSVTLLNTSDIKITTGLPWDTNHIKTLPFAEGCDGLDILIELGGQISFTQTQHIKRQGTKLISYCCGAEYVQNMEAIIFSRKLHDGIFINKDYDSVWIVPQNYDLNHGFLQTYRRCPTRKVPFVWHPMAIDSATKNLHNKGGWQPHDRPKRLSIIEPNVDVLKFCLYPILICELAFRKYPHDISFLHVANSDKFAHNSKEFNSLMSELDIVQAHKASFIGNVITPYFLAEHTDIVISHQWGLPLNYSYFECCWQGYPFIHNSEMIKELGYYYQNCDVEEGSNRLIEALHHLDHQSYRDRQRAHIWKYHAENPQLIEEYDNLLFSLVHNLG